MSCGKGPPRVSELAPQFYYLRNYYNIQGIPDDRAAAIARPRLRGIAAFRSGPPGCCPRMREAVRGRCGANEVARARVWGKRTRPHVYEAQLRPATRDGSAMASRRLRVTGNSTAPVGVFCPVCERVARCYCTGRWHLLFLICGIPKPTLAPAPAALMRSPLAAVPEQPNRPAHAVSEAFATHEFPGVNGAEHVLGTPKRPP